MSYAKWLVLVAVLGKGFAEQCLSRDYGNGGTVCVCNANHCDTLELETPQRGSNAVVYTSNMNGLRFEKKFKQLVAGEEEHKNKIIVGSRTFQEIIGFGGAFTDSTAINILSVNKALQEKILRSYFSKDGIQYSLGRVPIGGTDFSIRPYTYLSEEVDPQMKSFKLQPEDLKYKIPIIKRAYGYSKNLKLLSSAWSVPKWMKTNGKYTGPRSFLKEEYYQQWADYHVKFLDAYAEQNVTFWGMTTGNEPYSGVLHLPVPSVAWTAPTQGQWIQNNLGPAIRKSAHSNIKLMALDDQRFLLPTYIDIMFGSKKVEQYIDGIAVHWYGDKASPSWVLTETQKRFSTKFVLATEASIGIGKKKHVLLGSWKRAEAYVQSIITDIENFVCGWLDWNMVLDVHGGPTCYKNFLDAPIILNATAGEFYKEPMFYAMGHFSKFIPPGSRRIETKRFSDDVPVVGFKRPDGIIVLVIMNKTSRHETFTIKLDHKKQINLSIPGRSFTTILV